jgi:hypothetical protein
MTAPMLCAPLRQRPGGSADETPAVRRWLLYCTRCKNHQIHRSLLIWLCPPARVLFRPCDHRCPDWDFLRICAHDYEFTSCCCQQYERDPLAILHTNILFIDQYEGERHDYYPSGWDGLYTSLG